MVREYKQGIASLGFPGGPSVTLRINPSTVQWNFQINTSVTNTVGGRVVQVLGANLSDFTVQGYFGEQRGATHVESWEMAEQFLSDIKTMVDRQSMGATTHGQLMPEPAVFDYPPKGWKFEVYVKQLTDSLGSSAITHKTGRASYDYVLTMSILNDLTNTSRVIGNSNGTLSQVKSAAIEGYINRIAAGVGWKISEFNGNGPWDGTGGTPTTSTPPPSATPGPHANLWHNKPHVPGP